MIVMPFFLSFLFLLTPLWAEPLLTEDPTCIPSVIKALGADLHRDVVEDVQIAYQAFTSEPHSKLNAHTLWIFMASLRTSGDAKALDLYNQILQEGYDRHNTSLAKIGLQWGSQAMNETEQKIIRSYQPNPSLHQTRDDAYLASLIPILSDYWSTKVERNDSRMQSLPGILWPQKMVEEEAEEYAKDSEMFKEFQDDVEIEPHKVEKLKEGEHKDCDRGLSPGRQFMLHSLTKLIRYYGSDFPLQAELREKLWFELGDTRHEIWDNLCQARPEVGFCFDSFEEWAKCILQEDPSLLPSFSTLLLTIWIELEGNIDDFIDWHLSVLGTDIENLKFARHLLPIWMQLNGKTESFMKSADPWLTEIDNAANKATALGNILTAWLLVGDKIDSIRICLNQTSTNGQPIYPISAFSKTVELCYIAPDVAYFLERSPTLEGDSLLEGIDKIAQSRSEELKKEKTHREHTREWESYAEEATAFFSANYDNLFNKKRKTLKFSDE